jgi:replicative DNA helicase
MTSTTDAAARAREDARRYLAEGRLVVPLRFKKPWDPSQDCARDNWPKLKLTADDLEREFTRSVTGVGVILGAPSGNLVDVDLDCPEARAAADRFLPATRCVFGRPSTPRSHHEFIVDTPVPTIRYKDCDADKTTLLELRGTGGQSVFPRALHESGEILAFDEDGAPTHISILVLQRAVAALAATTLLARHWPRQPGSRHDLALALAGYLLRGGVDAEMVRKIVETAARIAGDPEVSDRAAAVGSTAAALAAGRPATGGPTLADLLSAAVVAKLTEWLGVRIGTPPPGWEPDLRDASRDAADSGGDAARSSDDPWPEPLPLDLLDVPGFPLDALPPVLADKVRDVARVTQTPPDLAATSALVAVAAVAARRVDVAIGRTHSEPVNLYAATIAESGTRKGPAQRAISKPLRALQAALRTKAEPEIQRAQQRRQIAEKHIEELRKQAAKAKDDGERERLIAEAAQLATELPVVPPLPTLIVGDRTPEKLEVDLSEQGGALLIQDEEAGTLFAIAGGRYSRDGSAPLDVYCKAYDRGGLDTARITRAHVSVDTPELSIDVTPQPILMRKLRERPEFHERGLLPRFLFAMPKSNVGYRPYDPAAAFDVAAATNYANLIAQLATLTRCMDGAELPHLRIEGTALQVWKRYADRVDRDCREGGRLYAIREWASKHPGRVARIAAALDVVDLAASKRLEVLRDLPSQNEVQLGLEKSTDLATPSVPPRTMAAACRLGKYYEGHALAAYDCMAGLPDIEGARRVLAWIRRTKQMRFSARDAFTELDRHFFRTMDDLIPCFVRLVEYAYIRWVPPPPRRHVGRPPSPVYEVNPRVHERLRTSPTPTPPPAAENGSAYTAEAAGALQARRENPKEGSADSAADAGAVAESGGGDPVDRSATAADPSADTAEQSGAARCATTPGGESETPGDAPQYPQNPGIDLPPLTRAAGDRPDGDEGDAQQRDGNAVQAPQYPQNPRDPSRPGGSRVPSEDGGEDDWEDFE